MTVASTTSKVSYAGNGSTTAFTVSFYFLDNSHLKVVLRSSTGTETVKTITTDYTVSGAGSPSGGTVTMLVAPASGQTLVITRNVPLTQDVDYQPNDPFPANTHEQALDKLTMEAQQINEAVSRSIKLSATNTMTSTEFTVGAADRANKVLGFDSAGELSVAQELGTYRGNWATSTAYAQRDIVKDSSNSNIYICITSHTSTGSVPISTNVNATNWSLLVDSASATSSASAAAASASAASTSASSASTSASSAASSASSASTSASTATTQASAASTSATNAASSASSASTSATAAANSATAAAAAAASGLYRQVFDKSANYTIVAADQGTLFRVNTSSGAVTITLPLISSVTDGFKVSVVKWTGDANGVTVSRSGSDTINGATTSVIGAQYTQTTFVADFETSQWFAATSGLGSTNVSVDVFSGNGSTTAFTLSGDPGSKNNTAIYISGVHQDHASYSQAGTTITFSSAPPSGSSNIEVVWTQPLSIGTPSDGTVGSTKIIDASVTTAKLADSSVTTAKIADANVTTAKIADANVTPAKLDRSYAALASANSFTAKQTLAATADINLKLPNVLETETIAATAATGTINYDALTQSIIYYTSNASANWTLNIRGSSSVSLNSLMATGESLTVVHKVTQGATAYYNSALQIDGSAVTPKWQGGSAPTAGNASSIDVYAYTITKTASATFTVLASQTQFK